MNHLIPKNVAKCPECGGHLYADILERDTETGAPTREGFEIECEGEECFEHRWWQSDWQDVFDAAYDWTVKLCRGGPIKLAEHKPDGEFVDHLNDPWHRLECAALDAVEKLTPRADTGERGDVEAARMDLLEALDELDAARRADASKPTERDG